MCCILTNKVTIPEKIIRTVPVPVAGAEKFFRLQSAQESAKAVWLEELQKYIKYAFELNDSLVCFDGDPKGLKYDYVDGNIVVTTPARDIWY